MKVAMATQSYPETGTPEAPEGRNPLVEKGMRKIVGLRAIFASCLCHLHEIFVYLATYHKAHNKKLNCLV